jgi:hypothetical protein
MGVSGTTQFGKTCTYDKKHRLEIAVVVFTRAILVIFGKYGCAYFSNLHNHTITYTGA